MLAGCLAGAIESPAVAQVASMYCTPAHQKPVRQSSGTVRSLQHEGCSSRSAPTVKAVDGFCGAHSHYLHLISYHVKCLARQLVVAAKASVDGCR
jgi:hypothetical protein